MLEVFLEELLVKQCSGEPDLLGNFAGPVPKVLVERLLQ